MQSPDLEEKQIKHWVLRLCVIKVKARHSFSPTCTFDSEDETTLVLGVGLHARHKGSHGPVKHGAVSQTHGLYFGQHVYDVSDSSHLLEWALTKKNQNSL